MEDHRGLFSLLRDATNVKVLEDFMISRGVDALTARLAAEQCQRAALRNAAGGGLVGGILAALVTSEAGGIGAGAGVLLGTAVGAGGTLLFSEQCTMVHNAAFDLAELRRRAE